MVYAARGDVFSPRHTFLIPVRALLFFKAREQNMQHAHCTVEVEVDFDKSGQERMPGQHRVRQVGRCEGCAVK